MVSLVEKMLDLHNQLAAAKIPQAKTMLQRQIEATDKQIDGLVYALYGLGEDEIRIVEGANYPPLGKSVIAYKDSHFVVGQNPLSVDALLNIDQAITIEKHE